MTTGATLRLGEFVLAAFVLALGLFVGFETWQMPVTATTATVGPRMFPFLVATGLVAVGIALLREAAFGHIAHERGFDLDWRAVALISGGLVLQMLLLGTLGWLVATTVMFVAATLAFAERRVLLSLLIGVLLSGATFLVFNWGLGLSLPAGSVIEGLLAGPEEEG
jgi:putative tricarboxylic transport membrane protein